MFSNAAFTNSGKKENWGRGEKDLKIRGNWGIWEQHHEDKVYLTQKLDSWVVVDLRNGRQHET